uniref:Tetratricopeptide repeat (TPR)-like superfamily protein n=1 Tax=Zea mays TaxID=4577 RepID=A0A804PAE5_MAIZE
MAAACLRRLHRIPHPVLKLAAATHWPLPFPGAKLAPVTQSCPSADRVEVQLSARCPGFASNGNFKHRWHHKLGSSVGAVLIGHAAFFLGLSNGSAFAQEDSVSPAAASEHAEGNAPGLQPIEDGSVVSNEHTVKWRIYTDNAREFFQKRQLDEAEKLFQAALLEAKEGFGLRDPHVASALNNLAEFYRLKKEHVKAEPLYLEAIEILEESFGPDDIRVYLPL